MEVTVAYLKHYKEIPVERLRYTMKNLRIASLQA
jgi:hypothetical protein